MGSFVAACARVVVSKSIYDGIPDRLKTLDEQGFSQRNPNVIDDQVTAPKVGDVQIGGGDNGLAMFLKTLE
jgi:hypothetical protein